MNPSYRIPSWLVSVLMGLWFAAGVQALPFTSEVKPESEPAVPFPEDLAWLNVQRPLTLADLRGKVVILDFWTYGCVNCLHVIPDLKRLKERYGERLAVIAVHSPKFDNEKNVETLRKIVLRYDRTTPVVQDSRHRLWDAYGVLAWPTLVVINPEGKVVRRFLGEGHYRALDRLVGRLVDEHAAALDRSPLPMALEKRKLRDQPLAFPNKVAMHGSRVAVADTLHHRVIVANRNGRIQRTYGTDRGFVDGAGEEARFAFPRGLAFAGESLYVADTGNHAIRRIDLGQQRVATVAGTGENVRPRPGAHPAMETALSSPWDLAYADPYLYIAMAGGHQIWRLDTRQGQLEHVAGSGGEGLRDGPSDRATFAQPSGLAWVAEHLYVADPEGSAVRRVDPAAKRVVNLIGQGLFEFGDRDGPFEQALLQHVLGVAALNERRLLITDTYNHKIKRLDLEKRSVETITGIGEPGDSMDALNEPGGIAALEGLVLVADTNNHRILQLDPDSGELRRWRLRR